jgi:hypothetical protein
VSMLGGDGSIVKSFPAVIVKTIACYSMSEPALLFEYVAGNDCYSQSTPAAIVET